VEPGDSEELAAVLTELLADPDRLPDLGRAGRRIAEERFAVDRMVRQTAEVYEEVVDR
jgi:starch synthase